MKSCLSLLKSVEAISSHRDRNKLLSAFLHSLMIQLGKNTDIGVCYRDPQGKRSLYGFSAPFIATPEETLWDDCIEEACVSHDIVLRRINEHNCGALLLHSSELSPEQTILIYDLKQQTPTNHVEEIVALARIFGNQIKLLEYSELDSLTRLLNRKTFEDTFDRLLTPDTKNESGDIFYERRRAIKKASQAWLCVIDLDFFKRINDQYGHLFGDEVLLRMGELMRKTFRDGDRLFRFGGEEFVVILNAPDVSQAEKSFDRFRHTVESYEFPRVGQVTCSIGFTAIIDTDVPTDVVGRADEALYYAKQHGRNRVCCYEALLKEGLISTTNVDSGTHVDGMDIDLLFG